MVYIRVCAKPEPAKKCLNMISPKLSGFRTSVSPEMNEFVMITFKAGN